MTMKANKAAFVCNGFAALMWLVASILYFVDANIAFGVIFLCLAACQVISGLLNFSAYRKEHGEQDPASSGKDA